MIPADIAGNAALTLVRAEAPPPATFRPGERALVRRPVVADSALSFAVGQADPVDLELIALTERALQAAIAVARAGNRTGDISSAIGTIGREAGLKVNTQFGGHGVGPTMHQEPHVPNDGAPGSGWQLRPGLVLVIKPCS